MKSASLAAVLAVFVSCLSSGLAGAAVPASLEGALRSFSEQWAEDDWVPKNGVRTRFMRPLDEQGWKARMRAFQAIVRHGPAAVEPVRRLLREGDAPQRALAAQALGFLPAQAAREDLMRAAANDEQAVVRLYAIDSLGMLGTDGVAIDWKSLAEGQKNRDVKRHLVYAAEREGKPLAREVIDTLADWDAGQMDAAKVGELAPDFELNTVSGEKVRLSDFRGKKAVVLVFVYGDT